MKRTKLSQAVLLLFILLSAAILFMTISLYHTDPSVISESADTPHYVFFSPNSKENFWCSIAAGIKAADQELHTDTLLTEYSSNDAIETYFMDALLTDPDGIIVRGSGLLDDAVLQAKDMDIPVVFYDSDVPDSERTCYIGVDNYTTGQETAQVLAETLSASGQILAITRSRSAYSQEDRVKALEEELKQYPAMEVVEYIEDLGDPLVLKTNLLQAIAQYPDLDAIICMEETASNYVGSLLRENQIDPERYFIVSLDFTDQTAAYLLDGTYDMVIMYDTRQIGYQAVRFLNQYQGESVSDAPASVYLDNRIITKENVKECQSWYEIVPLEWNNY